MAGRLLETRCTFLTSYERLFADALVSTYNIIYASGKQIKDKVTLLFEGVCGSELPIPASFAAFENSHSVVCNASLYFCESEFFMPNTVEIPRCGEWKRNGAKSLDSYNIFKYDTDFS